MALSLLFTTLMRASAVKKSHFPNINDRRTSLRNAPGFRSKRKKKLIDNLNREQLVAHYQTQVKFIAKKIHSRLPGNVELDDLISVGFIGLMDAAEKFDVKRGYQFKTYAEFRIRGAILDELRCQDWVPRHLRDKAEKIDRVRSRLERALGRLPSDQEIGEELGLDIAGYQELKNAVGVMSLVHFDEEIPKEDENSTQEIEQHAFKKVNRDDSKKEFDSLLELLPEPERTVLKLYYFRGLGLKEISQILEVTESRISQIHVKAIQMMRSLISAKKINSTYLFQLLLDLQEE